MLFSLLYLEKRWPWRKSKTAKEYKVYGFFIGVNMIKYIVELKEKKVKEGTDNV